MRDIGRDSESYFTFSKHDKDDLSGGLVRSILVEDVGLSEADARRALARKGKL